MKWFQQYLGNSFVVLYQHPINISVLKFSFLTGAWNVCSVQFSHSVASDSLRPHESQHTRPPCPSPTPGVYPSPCPSSRWCHPVISSFVIPFSFCPQSFPALGRIFFFIDFQWINSLHEVAKVLEFQLQHQSFYWTPRTSLLRMDWLDLPAVRGALKSLLQHHSSKASILQHSAFFIV